MSRIWVLGLLLVAGCKASDGETLRLLVRKTGEKLENATGPMHSLTSGMSGTIGEANLAARVETRLRWDRFLHTHRIKAKSDGQGKIVLTGNVADATMKTRAVDLAKSTLGVENVVDEMKVSAEK